MKEQNNSESQNEPSSTSNAQGFCHGRNDISPKELEARWDDYLIWCKEQEHSAHEG